MMIRLLNLNVPRIDRSESGVIQREWIRQPLAGLWITRDRRVIVPEICITDLILAFSRLAIILHQEEDSVLENGVGFICLTRKTAEVSRVADDFHTGDIDLHHIGLTAAPIGETMVMHARGAGDRAVRVCLNT